MQSGNVLKCIRSRTVNEMRESGQITLLHHGQPKTKARVLFRERERTKRRETNAREENYQSWARGQIWQQYGEEATTTAAAAPTVCSYYYSGNSCSHTRPFLIVFTTFADSQQADSLRAVYPTQRK